MATQTFITRWEDANGTVVDFERWSCKRLTTAIRKSLTLAAHPAYASANKRAVKIAIYRTPDGFHHEDSACWDINVQHS